MGLVENSHFLPVIFWCLSSHS